MCVCGWAAELLVPKSLGRETIASCRRQEVLKVEVARNDRDIRLTGWEGRGVGDRGLGAGGISRVDR